MLETLKCCCGKCDINEQTLGSDDNELDKEFDVHFIELVANLGSNILVEDYVNFDAKTCNTWLAIDSDIVDWK